MILTRLSAIIIFLQGVVPVLLFGAMRPSGWFLLGLAVVYALLTSGLWAGRRWAVLSAATITLPQLLILSSQLFTWRFYVGASYFGGISFASSISDSRLFIYNSVGAAFNCSFFRYNSALLAELPGIRSDAFLCINVVPIVVLSFLISTFILQFDTPKRACTLQLGAEMGSVPTQPPVS